MRCGFPSQGYLTGQGRYAPVTDGHVHEKPGLAKGMEEDSGEDRVRRAWLRWLGVGTGSLALVLVALWTQRTPIAENFVSRELNRRGVRKPTSTRS